MYIFSLQWKSQSFSFRVNSGDTYWLYRVGDGGEWTGEAGIELTLMSRTTEPSNKAASFPSSWCHATMLVTCALRAAGVLGAWGALAEQWWAHFGLTQNPAAMAGALRTGVNVPCLPFHKVLSSGCVANGRSAELWLLYHKVIWGMTQNQNMKKLFTCSFCNCQRPGWCLL